MKDCTICLSRISVKTPSAQSICVYGLRLQLTGDCGDCVPVSRQHSVLAVLSLPGAARDGIMKLYVNSSGREKEEKHLSFHLGNSFSLICVRVDEIYQHYIIRLGAILQDLQI